LFGGSALFHGCWLLAVRAVYSAVSELETTIARAIQEPTKPAISSLTGWPREPEIGVEAQLVSIVSVHGDFNRIFASCGLPSWSDNSIHMRPFSLSLVITLMNFTLAHDDIYPPAIH